MGNFKQDDVFGGRYKLTRKLGIGGFSEVWQAEDEMTEGTVVAVKIYAPEKGLDEYGLKQFRREYSLTQPLNHPNLLKASYFDIADGSPFLVMPYCSNGSVGHMLMERSTLGEEEIASILVKIAAGLSYLHSKDIVHQDIKPDNILIDDDNNYLLTDFGISSRMRSTLRKATTTSGALTVAYAPPERFDQNPQNTTAGDVFSMGVMLYELAEGDVPWMGSGGVSLLSGSKPPLISNKFSPEFAKLVQACMSLRMQDRPSAAQLAESAQQYLRTGKWDVSFIKDESAHEPAPAFSSGGRRTERLDSVPNIPPADNPSFSNSRNEAIPTAPQESPRPASGSATRADFAPTEEKKKSKAPLVGIIALVVVLVLGGGGYLFMQQQSAAAQKLKYEDAMLVATKSVEEEKYADAKAAYLAALEVYPEDAAAKTGLEAIDGKIKEKYGNAITEANGLFDTKKYNAAIEKYNVALQYMPDDKEATEKISLANYYMAIDSGDAYLALKDYAKARDYYSKALENKKGDEVAQSKFDDASRQEKSIKLAAVNGQLIAAVKSGLASQVKEALSAGADASAHDGKTPIIFIAAKNGNLSIIKDLVAAGAKCTDKTGTLAQGSASLGSPAVVAAANGKVDVIKYLVEECKVNVNDQEYDTNTKKNNGWSALGAAAFYGKLDVVKYLVARGANVNIKQGEANVTPLLEASAQGHYEIVKYLIENNADINVSYNGKDAYELTNSSTIKELLKSKGLGKLNLVDNFNSYSTSYFFPDGKMYTDKNRTITIENGKMLFVLKEDVGSSYTEVFNQIDVFQDYTLEVDLSQTGTMDPHGIVFAGMGGSGDSYRVLIDPDGGYVALKKYANGDWKSIVDYKQTSAIKQRSGSVNTLKIEKKGSVVNIYINGTAVISNQSLPRLSGNNFGFFCQTIGTKLTIDNFKMTGARK